jgi:DNA mismatch repair protein MutL
VGLRLSGWVAQPAFARSQADMQFFYVNGRLVRDKLVAHAVRQAYQDVLHHGRHPAYVLFLELPPRQVDVNVHPAKQEVRFREGRQVHDFIFRALHRRLAGASSAGRRMRAGCAPDAAVCAIGRRAELARAGGWPTDGPAAGSGPAPRSPRRCRSAWRWSRRLQRRARVSAPPGREAARSCRADPGGLTRSSRRWASPSASSTVSMCWPRPRTGLIIVDMHAAHERIGYERLKRSAGVRRAAPSAAAGAGRGACQPGGGGPGGDERGLLERLGLVVGRLGDGKLAVREIPALLQGADPEQLLRDVLRISRRFARAAAGQRPPPSRWRWRRAACAARSTRCSRPWPAMAPCAPIGG